MAALAEMSVVAPVHRAGRGAVPNRRRDGPLEIFHPTWVYPRGTGVITAGFLALQLIRPVLRLKTEFGFQLIDSHFGFPEGIAASVLSLVVRTPFVVTLRGCELLHCKYRFRRAGMAWALRRAALVITVSQSLRELATRLGVAPERVVAIPNGVDASVFYPRGRVESRKKHGLPLNRPVILTAGHLIELKGHHRVVEAARALIDEGVDVELAIAGGAPGRGMPCFESSIRRLVTELRLGDSVRFLGEVSQESMAELMSASDVFCLASSREGWPNVVHEAMACGTPVVAANVGAIPEMIPSDSYGVVVPPGDVKALAGALKRALANSRSRTEISAWAQSRSWEQVAGEVIERLRRIVAETAEG